MTSKTPGLDKRDKRKGNDGTAKDDAAIDNVDTPDPNDLNGRLDEALEESFPASDPPAVSERDQEADQRHDQPRDRKRSDKAR